MASIVLHSEMHAIAKAMEFAATLRARADFETANSCLLQAFNQTTEFRTSLYKDIATGEEVEGTRAIDTAKFSPEKVADVVGKYLNQWPDSKVVTTAGKRMSNHRDYAQVLADNGLDDEDAVAEAMDDNALKAQIHTHIMGTPKTTPVKP